MKPLPHQIEGAKEIVIRLRKDMICYLAWEERTMKSLTSLLAIEQLSIENCLIITKKGRPLKGWEDTLKSVKLVKDYTLTNFHKVKNITKQPDVMIIDEAHNYISGVPSQSQMNKELFRLSRGIPIIYLSATPCAQGPALLYYQLYLSSWSPWSSYRSYKSWFSTYGEPYTTYVYKRQVPKFDKVKDSLVWACVEHLFMYKTRKELGFDHEPEDQIHWIDLHEDTKFVYNWIAKKRVYTFKSGTKLVADTITKVRYSLHMLEGGVLKTSVLLRAAIKKTKTCNAVSAKYRHNYEVLGNTEKVDYIKKHWGDTTDLAIMYHFKAEKIKLEQHFKHAEILQATRNAEGIDLSNKKHLVIYSQDYSTARHSQRRARQANINRKEPINVHFLLAKGAISEAVYETVSINKQNYIDKLYKHHKL